MGETELAAAAGFVLALLLAGLAVAVFRRFGSGRGGLGPDGASDFDFSDGAVLIVDRGVIVAASPQADVLFGPTKDQQVARSLAPLLGEDAVEALAAVDRLVRAGEPLRIRVYDTNGRACMLIGEPRGGLVRIILRELRFPDAELTRLTSEIETYAQTVARYEHEARISSALLADGPIAAWSRDSDGKVEWTAGGIRDAAGNLVAAAAAAVAADRGSGATTPTPDGRERFRIEAASAPQAEPVVLDAVEIPGLDGGRLGFAVDAAGALLSERSLARFVRTMTETFAHLTVGLAIFDRNQTLAMFNPAVVKMWQVDPSWLAKQPSMREILDSLRANRRIPEMADFHDWRRRLTDLFQDTETADYEELWHLADGSDIRVLARPHPHGSLAFVFDDVTERLRLEQQYRHSVDLRRATLDRLDEGLAVFGPDGLLQLVNVAFHEIWGTDSVTVQPSMHARDLLPLVRGQTVETEVWGRLMTFITGGDARQAWSAQLTLGNGRILGARFASLPDGGTMAVFGDVTDSERIALALRERNEALESVEEMRAAVLDQVSHRLRTPLNTIFGYGQLLTDRQFGSLIPKQREYAEGILVSARDLLAMVDEVTEMAALEIDPLHNVGSDLPLGDMLMLTGRLLERRATEEGVSLRVMPVEGDLGIFCDAGKLRQIVFSMMTDAISRCRDGGVVELGARVGSGVGSREVEVFTLETLPNAAGFNAEASNAAMPDGAAVDLARAEADSLTLPVLRRVMAREGGGFELRAGVGGASLSAICRFRPPGAPESTVEAEQAG